MLKELCKLLSGNGALCMPRAYLRGEIKDGALTWLEDNGAARHVPLGEAPSYPCQQGAMCTRRVEHEPTLTAYCSLWPAMCLPERIADADAYNVTVDARSLAPMLKRSLSLQQQWAMEEDGVSFGDRHFGTKAVRFVLAPQPHERSTRTWLERLLKRDPRRALVALYFHPLQIQGGYPVEHPDLHWIALSDARAAPGGLAVDLLPLLERYAPHAVTDRDWWPRYDWVAHPVAGVFWYAGQRLDLSGRSRARRLLPALLWYNDQSVSRERLVDMVFFDELSPWTSDVERQQKGEQLRGVKSPIVQTINKALLPPGMPKDPIEAVGGGYRINVTSDRLHWLSHPDKVITGVADPSRPRRGPSRSK